MCARTWRTANADRHVRTGPRWHARGWLEQYSLTGSTSKSAVSRRFVKTTEAALAELRTSGLDLVALMIDEVHFGEHTCIVALGTDIEGVKHPLSLVEGSTENATLVTELCVDLRERGLDVTKPILAVLDGSKRCAAQWSTCWTSRCSLTANYTRSEMFKTIYRRSCAARSTNAIESMIAICRDHARAATEVPRNSGQPPGYSTPSSSSSVAHGSQLISAVISPAS